MEWSPVLSGLIGGLIASVLGALALYQQKRARREAGWRVLHPSPYVHLGLFLSAFLSGLIVYLYFFGPARFRAEGQEIYMLILLGGFGAGALWCWWWYYALTIRWRGATIEATRFGRTETFSRSDIKSVKEYEMTGECIVRFRDGRKLRFSLYMHGAKELIAALRRNKP